MLANVSKRKSTEFLRAFKDDGLGQGRAEGLKVGQKEAALNLTAKQLEYLFGPLSQRSQSRLKRLSLNQLEQLCVALLNFTSPRDLSAWLNEHANESISLFT